MAEPCSKPALRYFTLAFAVTAGGLILSLVLGWSIFGTVAGMLNVLFITTVLSVLEISLSFDNAIVNANKLREMTAVWQRRFLTWGILIAVFGMRIIFPLAVVCIAAKIGPWAAVELAWAHPDRYAAIMDGARVPISAFGGTFLLMVALSYFFDPEKTVHWLPGVERMMCRMSGAKLLVVTIVIGVITLVSNLFDPVTGRAFLQSAIWGLLTFLLVDVLGHYLDAQKAGRAIGQAGLGAFLYLEVLDASFSFDGVIGAFALTQNLFIIAIGLGIGAMYVRSMTVMLVEKGTLNEYRYLENGAFWSILVLAVVMFLHVEFHVPEAVTGLIGAALIGASFVASLRDRKLHG
ncbi:DUF475 domain-containing protein [Marivivens donghaensis]|uniref:DUF475 domain-containing protein n=1 Tax=Marivivens donghaensis TaxID=1699413 RepID=UPI00201F0379|nr:DUF475 domain-containing protein [Marivivens donghaensis]MCL7407736.1 DUF475 domain-containing protein [Marivivens donghaensis]MDN3704285.1 DUF475 domain-containing protein [Marivivens donghaensis]